MTEAVGIVGSGLVKRYGSVLALRGVDVRLGPGLTLIEGANGSGKSTLLALLGLAARPTSGEVRFEGLGDVEPRRAIGWASHEPLAYGDLSGRANVEFAARTYGLDPDRAWRDAAARFELGPFAERPLRTNSRGQRQRVALARALVGRPRIVLLDEPTTGLDRAGIDRLRKVVDEEVTLGHLVAVVTHDAALGAGAARIVLERGKLAGP